MDPSGRSLTNAGKVCGIIGTILLCLGVVLMILFFGLGGLGAVGLGAVATHN